MTIRPFSIDVPEAVLTDLTGRLSQTRWPEAIDAHSWDYGANIPFVREMCEYWASGYNWRRHEARLNSIPGFAAAVDGVDIHFWHVRTAHVPSTPLLLLHGWPGSIVEFEALIGPLTNPPAGHPAFDVVIPSLPGFGFSGKPKERGWAPSRIADALDALMSRELGYRRYGIQGGDWGSIVGSRMAHQHSENVVGLHLNFFEGQQPEDLSSDDQTIVNARAVFQAQETGYSGIQGTRPDSLTVAHTDSPAGLAASILEKFRAWSDCNGAPLSVFDRDTLLTNLMFYWAPASAASAARIYYESRRDLAGPLTTRLEVPTGIASYPKEPWRVPRHWAESRYNIKRFTEMESGGHFAALEDPDGLVAEIRAFFQPLSENLKSKSS